MPWPRHWTSSACPATPAISRSGTTAGILDAYQESTARGKAAFRKAFQASGIDPSDLPDFAWGSVMGLQEARALAAAAGFLELAIAVGDLVPGSKGWKLATRGTGCAPT